MSYHAIDIIENFSKTVMNFSSWFRAHTREYVVFSVVPVKHMFLYLHLQPVIIHANAFRVQVNAPSIPTCVLHYQHYLFCYSIRSIAPFIIPPRCTCQCVLHQHTHQYQFFQYKIYCNINMYYYTFYIRCFSNGYNKYSLQNISSECNLWQR